jgi:sortase (surface protein transpeptidase)
MEGSKKKSEKINSLVKSNFFLASHSMTSNKTILNLLFKAQNADDISVTKFTQEMVFL